MLLINDTLLMVVGNWLRNVGAFVYWKHADSYVEFKMEVKKGMQCKYVNITLIVV
jgi:hypothetical protein